MTISAGEKAIGSREAMRRTIATSPFSRRGVTSTTETVGEMLDACAAGDFTRIGELTESNALRMHATIEGAFPPIRYLNARSVAVFDAVAELRASGTEAYATADAGPNVVVLTKPEDRGAVAAALEGSARSSSRAPDQARAWSAPKGRRHPERCRPTGGDRRVIEFRAHGKLFVAGEYAVVEPGQPSVLIALDRPSPPASPRDTARAACTPRSTGTSRSPGPATRTAWRSTASTTPTTT